MIEVTANLEAMLANFRGTDIWQVGFVAQGSQRS